MNAEPGIAEVDLILLTRDDAPPLGDVARGVEGQAGVRLRVHRVTGTTDPGDPNRWSTIARARNEGKRRGSAPWVMFLDDDVVLGTDCVARLVDALRRRPIFAAIGADYLGETRADGDPLLAPHVAMGATLFRRDRLGPIEFRWEPDRCECQCCCDDLRRAGFGIGYLRGAEARHVRAAPPSGHAIEARDPPDRRPGRVLVAFDRNHRHKFLHQFLPSFRLAGNRETITAVCYGLAPSELNSLGSLPGVEVVGLDADGTSPALNRLRDFPPILDRWPSETPVAYWDAGDICFQAGVGPLWDLVRAHPDRLLAVQEPIIDPVNSAIREWTCTIVDPSARRYAYELLRQGPYLNGGFAAGTARQMARYCREAYRLRFSPAMVGTLDWGDQTALNLYCLSEPSRWLEVDCGWNFCLLARPCSEYRVVPGRGVLRPDGQAIPVVHGNAQTLRWFELSFIA